MNLSIVIPNYNGEEILKKNLPKVYVAVKNSKNKIEIIVVDDASTDSSTSVVSSLSIPNLKLFKNEKNMGFSSSVNKGVRNSKGEIILLLNSDVYPEEGFLEPLIADFKDPEVFAVGCMDKSIEDGKIVLRGRGIGSWKRGFLIHQRGEVDKSNTLWVGGGSGAFKKDIWNKLGGLNPLYNPFYWEDIDLSYRALKSGYKVLFERKSVVYHEHSKGSINKTYSKFKVKRVAYRNQFIFVWENATDLLLQFSHILFLPYHFLKALMSRDWAFLLGFIDAFVLLPKIIKSSFRSQKQFTKTDREVTKEFLK